MVLIKGGVLPAGTHPPLIIIGLLLTAGVPGYQKLFSDPRALSIATQLGVGEE